MNINEQLAQEIKKSMLARAAERLNTLRMLKSSIGYAQIERGSEPLADTDLIGLVQKEVKKRRDSFEQYQAGGRPELAEKEKAEIQVLEEFLPKALSPEELELLVKTAIQETGAASKKDMGKVIKAAQAKAAGRAEGRAISELVGKLLP